MSDNLQYGTASPSALSQIRVVALRGRDAAAFAQAQFMNDVLALPVGGWQWSGWLTPKGRVIALFALLRLDDEELWLLVPDADPAALAQGLGRFVFRSKVRVELTEVPVAGAFAAPMQASGVRAGRLDSAIELDVGTPSQPRRLLLGLPAGRAEGHEAAWLAADLVAGLPRLPAAEAERWTPQQLSLERLRAFSVKKGCYPGQEIVARTHFLGQAKRGLALFEADVAPSAVEIRDANGPWGSAIRIAPRGDRHLVLGVGSLDGVPEQATCGDVPLRMLPLQDGLAR